MSKFESPVSVGLHIFAKWEETGAAKGNIWTWEDHRKEISISSVLYMIYLLLKMTHALHCKYLFLLHYKTILSMLWYADLPADAQSSISFYSKSPLFMSFTFLHGPCILHPEKWHLSGQTALPLSSTECCSVLGLNFSDAPQCLLRGSDWGVGVLCMCACVLQAVVCP